jgi:MATE family, multidrug efflux pump
MLGPTIDMIWVGKLGSAEVAGVGLAGLIVQLLNSMVMGVFMGLGALVARYIGASDTDSANQATRQAFAFSVALSIIMALIGIFFSESLLGLFGVSADVIVEGAAYLRISFAGMVAMVFLWMCSSAMQASGDTVNPMRLAVVSTILRVALCPFLVFGWWIFPRLGVSGAALAGVFSSALGGAIGLWFLLTGHTRLMLDFKNFRFDLKMIWRIVKIGLPASVNNMQASLVGVVIMSFIAPFGTMAVAAHSIMSRIEMVVFMPGMGLGQGAAVLVGQHLGASQPERAEKSGWLATGLVEAIMVTIVVVLFLWPKGVVRIFNIEPGVVEIGSTFIRIATVGYLFVGATLVLSTCINMAGDTIVPMTAGLISMWAAQIPLAYFLPRVSNLGIYGVRWAIVIAMVMRAVTYLIYFRLGPWKRKRV